MSNTRRLSLAAGLWLLLCGIAPDLVANAAGSWGSTYRLRQWTTEQGLPNSSVNCLAQTRDGYLWAGTMFGLLRFDGVSFRVLDQANLPEFQKGSDSINAVVEDSEGALWIATANGLVRNLGGQFTRFTTEDGLPHNTVLSLARCSSGGLWIGTHSGLGFWKQGHFVRNEGWKALQTYNISALTEEGNGRLWIAHRSGLSAWTPEGLLEVTNHLESNSSLPSALFTDRSGQVWVGGRPSGDVFCISSNRIGKWQLPPNLAGGSGGALVTAFCEANPHQIQAFVRGVGLVGLGANGFELVAGDPLPKKSKVRCALADAEGNLWVGAQHEGLLRLQKRLIETYAIGGDSEEEQAMSVYGSADGVIWAGTGTGIVKLEDGRFNQVPYKDHSNWTMSVASVFVDRQQRVWGAPRGAGLVQLQGGQFIQVNPSGPGAFSKNLCIEAIWQDPDDTLWFGSGDGLWRLAGEQWTRLTRQDGVPPLDIRCLLRHSSGALWMGTHGGGLGCYQEGTFKSYTEKDGLPHGQVHCLLEDSQHTLWAGTQLGLVWFRDGQIRSLSTRQGLFDNCINNIQEDENGRLWMSCNRGIYSALRSELAAVADGQRSKVNCRVYGEPDGMLSNETNGEHQPSGWKGPDGRLWFPTQKGLAILDPKRLNEEEQPVRINVERVRANGQTIFDVLPWAAEDSPLLKEPRNESFVQTADGTWNFPPEIRQILEFHYAAATFTAPERVKYRYTLEGYETQWHEAGAQRRAAYTNLHPGRYKFRVAACNHHGVWNETSAVFAFSIAPYFSETASFYVLCALGGLAIAFSVHHYRVRGIRQLQEAKAEAALAEQRARIARDMHDDLGANLSKIALINEVVRQNINNPKLLQNQTTKIAEIAGQTVDGLSELVWAANPKYDTVDTLFSYLREYVAQFFEATAIRCQLSTSPPANNNAQVDFKMRRHLFLVVKEALHNILKHSRASVAEIHMSLDNRNIVIMIKDNGIGLQAEGSRRGGNGLSNMRQRIQECNGTLKIESLDRQGTSICVQVPLSS